MDREEVIRVAIECGINAESDTLCRYGGWVEPMERFASIVATTERERCAKVAENCFVGWPACGSEQRNVCAAAIRALL